MNNKKLYFIIMDVIGKEVGLPYNKTIFLAEKIVDRINKEKKNEKKSK